MPLTSLAAWALINAASSAPPSPSPPPAPSTLRGKRIGLLASHTTFRDFTNTLITQPCRSRGKRAGYASRLSSTPSNHPGVSLLWKRERRWCLRIYVLTASSLRRVLLGSGSRQGCVHIFITLMYCVWGSGSCQGSVCSHLHHFDVLLLGEWIMSRISVFTSSSL